MGHDMLYEFVELELFPGENTVSVAVLNSACLYPAPTQGPRAAVLSVYRPWSLSPGMMVWLDVST